MFTSGKVITSGNKGLTKLRQKRGLHFRGDGYSTGAVDTSYISPMPNSKTFTFSCWYYLDDDATSQKIFHLGDGDSFWVEHDASGYVSVFAYQVSGAVCIDIDARNGCALARGSWNHIAISIDTSSTTTRHFFVNGLSAYGRGDVATTTYTVDSVIRFNQSNSIAIGRDADASSNYINGYISDIFLDDVYRDLESPEVLSAFMSERMPTQDLSYVMSDVFYREHKTGMVGAEFNGKSEYLKHTKGLRKITNSQRFTLSLWVKAETGVSDYMIYSPIASSAGRRTGGISLYFSSTKKRIYFTGHDADYTQRLTISNPIVFDNTSDWNHILISSNSATSSFDFYVNDVDYSSDFTGTANYVVDLCGVDDVNDYWTIGSQNTSNYFKGNLAHVYMNTEYFDLSVESNRRKFITADGDPATGLATLGQDAIYHALPDGTRGAYFRGNEDYLSYENNPFDNGYTASETQFTLSFWAKHERTGLTHYGMQLRNSSNNQTFYYQIASSTLNVGAMRTDGTTVFTASVTGLADDANWHHYLVSIDLTDTGKRYIYIDGVVKTPTWSTYNTAETMDFTADDFGLVSQYSGGTPLRGRAAHYFFDNVYRDLSIAANRELFIDSSGYPASGQASLNPLIYYPLADDFNNYGTGGTRTFINGHPNIDEMESTTQPALYFPLIDDFTNYGFCGDFDLIGLPEVNRGTRYAQPKIYFKMVSVENGDIVNSGTGDNITIADGIITQVPDGLGSTQIKHQNGGVRFDGSSEDLRLDLTTAPTDTKEFTFSCIYNRELFNATYADIFHNHPNTSTQFFFIDEYNGTQLRLQCNGVTLTATTTKDTQTSDFVTRKWHLIQATGDMAAGTMELYIDGVQVAQQTGMTDQLIDWGQLFTVQNNHQRTTYSYSSHLGEVYFDTTKIDLSSSNPFLDAENQPIPLLKVIEDNSLNPLIALPMHYVDTGKNYGSLGDFEHNLNASPVNAIWSPSSKPMHVMFNDSPTSTYYIKNTAPTGISDGDEFTFVGCFQWITGTSNYGVFQMGDRFEIMRTSAYQMYIKLLDTSGVSVATHTFTTTSLSGLSTWSIFALSMKRSTGDVKCYINDIAQNLPTLSGSDPFDFTGNTNSDCRIFSTANYTTPTLGKIGTIYFTPNYIDLDTELYKFTSATDQHYIPDLTPMINSGELPTPWVHMTWDDQTDLGHNKGTCGDFVFNDINRPDPYGIASF